MFEQLKHVFVYPTILIKLRFCYKMPNLQVKVLNYLLNTKFIQSKQLSVYDFLISFMEDILTPLLLLQSKDVYWETVNITYPLKKVLS
uniref:Uncharacterized protein n=1 Tax=Alsidium seaforthii TaxID=2007182 RepID=A0A1Z1MD56_9FLOR|nr:hypothetical protein [Bryothamnion seaforthii]ARW63883.1 hypothetical protein [Bryothamnion seaforthii]